MKNSDDGIVNRAGEARLAYAGETKVPILLTLRHLIDGGE